MWWVVGRTIEAGALRPRRTWQLAAGALGLATVVISSGILSDRLATIVTDAAAVLTALGGAWVVLTASRTGTNRAAWRLLAVAMLLWGVGEVLWGYVEVIVGDEVPFPSVADVAYLGAVPFAIAGLLTFARGSGGHFQLRSILDACLVSGALLFITWALVLGPAWRTTGDATLEHLISVAYPATDLVLAVLALVIVHWGIGSDRSSLRLLAAALLVMAVTDSAFTWLTTNGTFSSSNPIAMLWPASYLMIARAATLHDVAAPTTDLRDQPIGSLLAPYLPLAGAVAVATPRALAGDPLGPFLAINGTVLLVLLLVRQGITAWDLRSTVAILHEQERVLERLALEDPLTGLPNRASFATRLEAAVGTGREPAVIYIDLDGFKQINDSFGHGAGDELLVEVARRLEACLGPGMLVARLGGDEFVVLVEPGHAAAVSVARQILQTLAFPFHAGGETVRVAASLGIAAAPADGSPDEAVRRADAAMYVAKTSGKGRAVDYPDENLVVLLEPTA